MKIVALKEQNDNRVAIVPGLVKSYMQNGFDIFIEKGAGLEANFLDEDYKKEGATVFSKTEDELSNADIILTVSPLSKGHIRLLRKEAIVIGLLNPYQNKTSIEEMAKHNITSFALELLPRITRAQSMDVLSSQSNLAGYRAVIEACYMLRSATPMMMTAAGTITASKVLILGAGVAGLQAIATAKRLGAIVSVFDVRIAAKEQVESLGAKFIQVEEKEGTADTVYASEMSKEYQKKQQLLIEEQIQKQDIVITTALIPGKPAPKLITKKMVDSMKPGSVIVDMATSSGGNCEYSVPGEVINHNNITIIGYQNLAARIPFDASKLYAKNLLNFVMHLKQNNLIPNKEINFEDEIVSNTLVTYKANILKQ